jgi:methylmalonyl-CoA mutase N-terminal domain/subunit
MRVERGDVTVVGVNRFEDNSAPLVPNVPDYRALESEQVGRVRDVRKRRDNGAAERALAALGATALAGAAGMMPRILDAVRARCTVGEISDVLRGVWGEYRP